ncbi:hypothetical protein [Celeribacter halophilus]|uniref:hypothetical protein n=1 Tax=Celeribacter halophilus TaxID=576117 RepID=UPI003A910C80
MEQLEDCILTKRARRMEDVERIYKNALKDVDPSGPQKTIETIRLQAWRAISLDLANDLCSEDDFMAQQAAKEHSMFLELLLTKTRKIEVRQKAVLALLMVILLTLWF